MADSIRSKTNSAPSHFPLVHPCDYPRRHRWMISFHYSIKLPCVEVKHDSCQRRGMKNPTERRAFQSVPSRPLRHSIVLGQRCTRCFRWYVMARNHCTRSAWKLRNGRQERVVHSRKCQPCDGLRHVASSIAVVFPRGNDHKMQVLKIHPVGNLRRCSWDLQLHVGINRLVLWRRNAQLLCRPHQLCQRSGPHLLHHSPTLNFDGKFGGPQPSGNLLIE
jgi:hypothetical protein